MNLVQSILNHRTARCLTLALTAFALLALQPTVSLHAAEVKTQGEKKVEVTYRKWTGTLEKLDSKSSSLVLKHGIGSKAKSDKITWTEKTIVKKTATAATVKDLAVGQRVQAKVRDHKGTYTATTLVIDPPKPVYKKKSTPSDAKKEPSKEKKK